MENPVGQFLESTPVHAVSLGLLVIDLIFTILELSSSLLVTGCRPKDNNNKTTEEIWYHWVGISILALLSAKTVALAVGLGSTFFRRPDYVIDGIVLIGALGLEVFFRKDRGRLLETIAEKDKIIQKLQEGLDQCIYSGSSRISLPYGHQELS
ncbi:hypothetical protein M0R45_020047 [Rubus argutus]|uniref:Uncharacterized protein n=1 Tax=Rubus argutus TaxID=59490 RepID=A0AAW1X7S6_RUBAR